MKDQLLQIRQQVALTLKQLDNVLLSLPEEGSDAAVDTLKYRTSPGGMLSELGVEEMYRRFEEGEPDSLIAKEMGVSVQGVQKRRGIWKSTGMSKNDPIYIRMRDIIRSEESVAAMKKAATEGLPALAAIEPKLVAVFGKDYGQHNQGTMTAGALVGEVMYSLGFKKGKSAPMPEGSVAKTAATWLEPNS